MTAQAWQVTIRAQILINKYDRVLTLSNSQCLIHPSSIGVKFWVNIFTLFVERTNLNLIKYLFCFLFNFNIKKSAGKSKRITKFGLQILVSTLELQTGKYKQ